MPAVLLDAAAALSEEEEEEALLPLSLLPSPSSDKDPRLILPTAPVRPPLLLLLPGPKNTFCPGRRALGGGGVLGGLATATTDTLRAPL